MLFVHVGDFKRYSLRFRVQGRFWDRRDTLFFSARMIMLAMAAVPSTALEEAETYKGTVGTEDLHDAKYFSYWGLRI